MNFKTLYTIHVTLFLLHQYTCTCYVHNVVKHYINVISVSLHFQVLFISTILFNFYFFKPNVFPKIIIFISSQIRMILHRQGGILIASYRQLVKPNKRDCTQYFKCSSILRGAFPIYNGTLLTFDCSTMKDFFFFI